MRKLSLLVGVLALLVIATGCHHSRVSEVAGSGKRVTEKRNIGSFTSISTEGAFWIEVTCQKELSLEVEGDDNILPFVKAEVGNNVLRLTNTKSYSTKDPIKIRISVPNLEGLTVEGAGKIDINGMNNESFDIDASGAPEIVVTGSTKMINIDSSGAAQIDTYNLRASRAKVDSKGAGKIELDVADQLDVTVSGPASVLYKGDPVVNKTINGPGTVARRGGEGA